MPPYRQCPRRSARLSALAQSFAITSASSKMQQQRDGALSKSTGKARPTPNPPARTTRGKGKGKAQEATGPPAAASKSSTPKLPNIIWGETRVQELVSWLVTRPADRNILYHDRNQSGPAPSLSPDQRPSGKQKKDIHAAIAKHIFDGRDSEYSNDPDRYTTSVCNRLTAYVHSLQVFVFLTGILTSHSI
jgi:hypothetical protein